MEIEIVNYIKEARQHGLPDQEIKQNLLDVGWDPGQVEDSFNHAKLPESLASQTAPPIQAAPKSAVLTHPQITPAFQPAAGPDVGKPDQPPRKINFAELTQTLPAHTAAPLFPGAAHSAAPAGPALSDANLTKPRSGKKLIIILAVVAAIVLLGAGGYFAYGYFSPSPAKVWSGFLSSAGKNSIVSANFNYTYSDPGILQNGKNQSFTLTLSGSSYVDATNTSSPSGTVDLTGGYQLSSAMDGLPQSGSVKLSFLVLDKIVYADLSNIPQIKQLTGQQISWVKLDLAALENLASTTPYGMQLQDQMSQQKLSQDKLKKDLANILKNNQVISVVKTLGSETISGTPTYHLQNQVDKNALKQVVNTIFDDAYASSSLAQTAEIGAAKQIISSAIDKVNINTFETWIGKKDSQLYQIKLDLKFPGAASWADSLSSPLGQAQSKSRDAQRLADMRQMASALELYYNDHNGYPAGSNGTPVGINPTYIGVVPTAPTPSDGSCTDYYNSYWYQPQGTPTTNNGLLVYPSYQYTFCLGGLTGSYAAGIGKLAPQGITANIPCNDKPENCTKQTDTQEPAPSPAQPQADLSILVTYSNYGKKQTLTPPANPFDVVQYIQQQMDKTTFPSPLPVTNNSQASGTVQKLTPDEDRLVSIEGLASSLELYFNDNNSYPKDLNQLVPKYISTIPSAPVPPDGSCTPDQNSYKYKFINSNNYQLTFCLGAANGGYQAGPHTLSQAGIK